MRRGEREDRDRKQHADERQGVDQRERPALDMAVDEAAGDGLNGRERGEEEGRDRQSDDETPQYVALLRVVHGHRADLGESNGGGRRGRLGRWIRCANRLACVGRRPVDHVFTASG